MLLQLPDERPFGETLRFVFEGETKAPPAKNFAFLPDGVERVVE